MFYELMEQLDAECLIISLQSSESNAALHHGRFRFRNIVQNVSGSSLGLIWNQRQFSRAIISAVGNFDPHIVVSSTHNPATSVLVRRQGAARAHFQGRTIRHPQAADYRGDVAPELAGPQIDPRRFLAGAHSRAKAKDDRGDRFGQQDGSDHLGRAEEE